jgi:hypothetical protein
MRQFFSDIYIAARDFIKYVWPAIGPLIGVLVGAYIANRNQRKQWIEDKKQSEYRELLSTLHRNSMKMAALVGAPHRQPGLTATEQDEYDELNRETTQVIDDRIFIAKEITDLDIRKEWVEVEYALAKHWNVGDFSMGVHSILKKIRGSVEKIIE